MEDGYTTYSRTYEYEIADHTGKWSYFLAQVPSGHGCFRRYLFTRMRAYGAKCTYYIAEDDAEHTLFHSAKWKKIRKTFYQTRAGLSTVQT